MGIFSGSVSFPKRPLLFLSLPLSAEFSDRFHLLCLLKIIMLFGIGLQTGSTGTGMFIAAR